MPGNCLVVFGMTTPGSLRAVQIGTADRRSGGASNEPPFTLQMLDVALQAQGNRRQIGSAGRGVVR